MIGLLGGRARLLGLFAVFLSEGGGRPGSFPLGLLRRLCGVVFYRILMLVLLDKGAFVWQSRSSSSIRLLERNVVFLWVVGVCAVLMDI